MNSLGTDFDTLLTRGAVAALMAAGAWTVLVVTAVALEARTRGRVRFAEHTGCPPTVRLWLLGIFVALFAGVAPANASDTGSGASGAALDGLPLPDRAAGAPAAPHADSARVIVVRPGDSLWRIARTLLPRHADDAAVATTVATLYAHNCQTIGPDPDLLEPDQHLTLPEER